MRAVVQRVDRCALTADGVPHGEMQTGLLALVGFQSADDEKAMRYILDKLVHLRVFEDENGLMNLSISDLGLSLFLVPNFTLYGDCRHGRRPGFSAGAPVAEAAGKFEAFLKLAQQEAGVSIETGVFQAHMVIQTQLNGPVTLLLDSDKVF